MNLLDAVTLNSSTPPSSAGMDYFPMCNFGYIMYRSFGKYWFTELCRFSKRTHSLLRSIKRITFANSITAGLNRSAFEDKEATKCVVTQVFRNSDFPPKAHVFSLATSTHNCFP